MTDSLHLEMIYRMLPSINIDVLHGLVDRYDCNRHVQLAVKLAFVHVKQGAPITQNPFFKNEVTLVHTIRDRQ